MHILLIGYVFTTMMFALAQGSVARILIYLLCFTVLPTAFVVWVMLVRRRNKLMKMRENADKSLPK